MAVTRINKKQMSELDKEYEASLKSIETENKIDRIFYRHFTQLFKIFSFELVNYKKPSLCRAFSKFPSLGRQ